MKNIINQSVVLLFISTTIAYAKEVINYNNTATDSNIINDSVEEAKLDSVSLTLSMCDLISSEKSNNINISSDHPYGLFEYILQEGMPCPMLVYWQISSPPGSVLNMTFSYFRTRHCSESCLCDRLTLWDVMNDKRHYRSYYCGHRDPWYIVTKTNKIFMRLEIVDANKSFILMTTSKNLYFDEITGFVIIYRTLSAGVYQYISPIYEIKMGGFSKARINLPVPHMKINGYYIYHVKLREREQFKVKLSWKITCRNVFITLYDGPSERHPVITKYTTKKNRNSSTDTGFHLYVVLRIWEVSHHVRDTCVNLKYGSELAPFLQFHTSLVGEYKVNMRKRPFIHNYFQIFGIKYFHIDGPNYEFCSVQGIGLAVIKKVKKTGRYKAIFLRFCNIPRHKEFLSTLHADIDMFLSIYSYSLSTEYDLKLILTYANTNKKRDQFCQPVYSTFSAFEFYTETIKHPGNTTFPSVMKVPSDHQIPCFHLRIAPGYHAQKTNIRIEIHGADYVLTNNPYDPFHQLNPPVALLINETFLSSPKTCTGYIKTEKDERNTVIINYQLDCPYTPIGFSLNIYNNMMCSVIPKDQTMLEKHRCQILEGRMSIWTPSRFFLYFNCEKITCDKNVLESPDLSITVKQTPFILHNNIQGLESSLLRIPESFKLLQEPVLPSNSHLNEDINTNSYTRCEKQRMSWNEAKTNCENDGKQLLTITDLKELHNIKQMLNRCGPDLRYWSMVFLGLKVIIFSYFD